MNTVYKNTAFLSVAQIAGYIIPLLELPILARALGSESYAKVILFQSIALMGSLLIEYGFNLSAARQVATAQGKKRILSQLFADVFFAKILLSLVVVLTFCAGGLVFEKIRVLVFDSLAWWALIYVVAFGFSPFWYFKGSENMALPVLVDFLLRAAGIFLLYVYVKKPEDAGLALGIMSGVGLTNTLVMNLKCLSEIGVSFPSLKNSLSEIRCGFHVFLYGSANSILLSASPSIVGFTAGRNEISAFIPAEKVIRGMVGFTQPVLMALFPIFSRKFSHADENSLGTALKIIVGIAIFGVVCALLLAVVGPAIVYKLLGNEFAKAGFLLAWFVWLIPIRMVNQALGLLVLLPMRKDKIASRLLICFSLLAMILGGILSGLWGSIGMVYGLIAAEIGLLITLLMAVGFNNEINLFRNEKRLFYPK